MYFLHLQNRNFKWTAICHKQSKYLHHKLKLVLRSLEYFIRCNAKKKNYEITPTASMFFF